MFSGDYNEHQHSQLPVFDVVELTECTEEEAEASTISSSIYSDSIYHQEPCKPIYLRRKQPIE